MFTAASALLALISLTTAAYIPRTAGIARDVTDAANSTSDAANSTSSAPTSGIASAHTGVGDSATRGLLVQFAGSANASNDAITQELIGAVPAIEQEPGTLSWFGGNVDGGNATSSFVVFDTFLDETGRAAHLAGKVAGSVVGQTGAFTDGLSILPFDILAVKASDTAGANVTLGLRILFTAQADQIGAVQQFCRDALALVQAEPGTTNWLCVQVGGAGSATFGILDSFPDAAARTAHLNGEVAKQLFASVPTLLTGAPDVQEIDISAATVKSAPPPPVPAVMPMTSGATLGLLVPVTAQQAQSDAFRAFVASATPLAAAEPGTLQWFGAAIQNATTPDFIIYDTFADDAGRTAHLGGKVAGGLLGQMGSLASVDIIPYDILAIKSTNDATGPTAGVTRGLRVFFNSTADNIPKVQQFCRDSLPLAQAEAGTLNWICFQVPGTATFGILDSFPDDDARTAHLNGAVAKGLFAIVPTLLTGQPDIQMTEIFAATAQPGAAGDQSVNATQSAVTQSSPAAAVADASAVVTTSVADATLLTFDDWVEF